MTGVRFARMTGPGPSGFRPEHFSAMLECRRRRPVNRLLRAIAETEHIAANVTLPPEGWSWIMDSRLVYVAKKSGTVPNPIRVAEIWRRLISKHLLRRHEVVVRFTTFVRVGIVLTVPTLTVSLILLWLLTR